MSSISFTKSVNIQEIMSVQKLILVGVSVKGNSATANATADALGHNTVTETLTQTAVAQGIGSSSASESLSATSGFNYHIW